VTVAPKAQPVTVTRSAKGGRNEVTLPHFPATSYLESMLKRFIDLLLYGNIWIALNAAAMVLLTHWILTGVWAWTPMAGFVAFGTWFVYALHRVVGLKRVQPFTDEGRYRIIAAFQKHIWVYALLGLVGASFFFFQFSWSLRVVVILPSAIALGYVLPARKTGKRLRDFHFLKIFLIALSWGWLTVFSPAAELNLANQLGTWLLALERAAFIFAITLPFDIRDLQIDKHLSVETLPSKLGTRGTQLLCLGVLLLAIALGCANFFLGIYSAGQMLGLLIGYSLTSWLCWRSPRVQHDYYFSGLIDGTMIIMTIFLWLGDLLF
jgi:4-hydroxybenzoate polyprenyltransferase